MPAEYAMVLGLTLLFPLLLSRDPHLRIRTNLRALASSGLLVCAPYWLWDIAATARGHWSFHPDRILGVMLLGMPVEEWLFFPVVVFVSVFTWESVRYFAGKRP
jgi:lycopene cyclase domain-containing protein